MNNKNLRKALQELGFVGKEPTTSNLIAFSLFRYIAKLDKDAKSEGNEKEWVRRTFAEVMFLGECGTFSVSEEVIKEYRAFVPNILSEDERSLAYERCCNIEDRLIDEGIVGEMGFGDLLYVFVLTEPFHYVSEIVVEDGITKSIVADGICRYTEYDGLDDYYVTSVSDSLNCQAKEMFDTFIKQRYKENDEKISGKDVLDALEYLLEKNN